MTKIVVGIDGSESALAALRWAIGEARLREILEASEHLGRIDGLRGRLLFPQDNCHDPRRIDL